MEYLNRKFDGFVRWVHQIEPLGVDIHPYLLFLNLGVIVSLLLIFVYSAVIAPIDVFAYTAIFVVVVVGYENVYTDLKERLISTKERNYPLDALVYLLPIGLALAYVAGLDIGAIAPLAAMQLAVSNGFTRIGCFSGGCCYGRHASVGVEYPDQIFTEHDGFQAFSPGENPHGRVFPCQLIEMIVQFGLFGGLFIYLLFGNTPSIALLVAYLCGYAVFRFLNDFTRQYTHRPTYGSFTEGQVISLCILAVGVPYLVF